MKASSERKGIDAEAQIFALVTGKNAIWEKMTKKKSNIQSQCWKINKNVSHFHVKKSNCFDRWFFSNIWIFPPIFKNWTSIFLCWFLARKFNVAKWDFFGDVSNTFSNILGQADKIGKAWVFDDEGMKLWGIKNSLEMMKLHSSGHCNVNEFICPIPYQNLFYSSQFVDDGIHRHQNDSRMFSLLAIWDYETKARQKFRRKRSKLRGSKPIFVTWSNIFSYSWLESDRVDKETSDFVPSMMPHNFGKIHVGKVANDKGFVQVPSRLDKLVLILLNLPCFWYFLGWIMTLSADATAWLTQLTCDYCAATYRQKSETLDF